MKERDRNGGEDGAGTECSGSGRDGETTVGEGVDPSDGIGEVNGSPEVFDPLDEGLEDPGERAPEVSQAFSQSPA